MHCIGGMAKATGQERHIINITKNKQNNKTEKKGKKDKPQM